MRYFLTALIICCSFIVSAKGWSIGAAGGTSRWNQLARSLFEDIHAGGCAAEIEIRYTSKKATWAFGAALNTGRYSHYIYEDAGFGIGFSSDVNARAYSLRLSTEYIFFDFGKCYSHLFKRFSLSAGISVAPIVYDERRFHIDYYKNNKLYTQDPERSLSALAGVQGRLSYKLTRRLNINLSGIIQTDFFRIFEGDNRASSYFRPDVPLSALLGVSWRL